MRCGGVFWGLRIFLSLLRRNVPSAAGAKSAAARAKKLEKARREPVQGPAAAVEPPLLIPIERIEDSG